MNEQAQNLSKYRLQRAFEDLEAARINLAHNLLRTSLNRSYYAMLHSVRALLALEKVDFKTHKGVINYFSKNYIRTGKLPENYGRIIAIAEERRINSDYDEHFEVDAESVKKQLAEAEEMTKAVQAYFEAE